MPLEFTYGDTNVDTLLATTKSVLQNGAEYFSDAIFNKIPLLNWLQQKAQKKKGGGASILVPIMFAKNGTVTWYSGFDVLDTTAQEGFTLAQFHWRNVAGSISVSGDELRKNSGEGQLKSMMEAKTMQGLLSVKDDINAQMFASTQGTKKIQTLVTLIDATSTIGDINSTNASWWGSIVTTGGSFGGQGLADMLSTYNDVRDRGLEGGAPDLLLTTSDVSEFYERSQSPQMRYTIQGNNPAMADAGFDTLKYKGALMTTDPQCNSGVMYLLRSANLALVVHSQAEFAMTEFVKPSAQDAKVAQIIWSGNVTTNNRRKLAKITTISV